MLARFNGNVVPFANDATSTNRTVFGGTTQSDTLDDNLNADFKKGWEIVGLNDSPTREDFNAMGYTLGALTSYLYQMGIAEYNALQEYKLNGLCLGTDGTIYQSLVDANIGNALTNGTKWKNVTGSYVTLTGNQTIAGVKTFSSSPIVPTPTTGTQAVNKDYADLKVELASFIGTNQSLAENGYQKLPGGLILQWGTLTGDSSVWRTVTYPIAFTSEVFSITTPGIKNHTVNYAGNGGERPITIANTSTPLTSFRWAIFGGSTSWGGYYIAIGY